MLLFKLPRDKRVPSPFIHFFLCSCISIAFCMHWIAHHSVRKTLVVWLAENTSLYDPKDLCTSIIIWETLL